MPDDLVDVLRLAARRPGNASTVAALMQAIDHFRQPRAEMVMTDAEFGQITAPAMFCLGTGDPFLTPAQARPSVAKIAGATMHEVHGGHAPWLDEPEVCAKLVTGHLAATGFAPAL
jgi:pimeloyl-ACP methyl ester carboxylesterase